MSNQELTAFVAVFGGIALFTTVLTLATLRMRRADDAASLALRASRVAAQTRHLRVGPDFLWAAWQNTADAAAMTLLIRDERDATVSTVIVPAVALDGVLRRFELDGKHYEIRSAGLMSNRSWLCETGRDAVLLSADHETLRTRFFEGDGGRSLFTVPMASVLKPFRPIEADGQEIGKLIVELPRNAAIKVITLPAGRWSRLEQVFVLASP